MKKCRTCHHWKYSGFNMGDCTGIFSTSKVIEKTPDEKGRKRGLLIVGSGISPNKPVDFVITESDWSCGNWKRKKYKSITLLQELKSLFNN